MFILNVCVCVCLLCGWVVQDHPPAKQEDTPTHTQVKKIVRPATTVVVGVCPLSLCVLPACACFFVGLADCRSVWVSRGMPAEYRSVSMLDRQGEQTDDVSNYQTDAVNASSPMYVQD